MTKRILILGALAMGALIMVSGSFAQNADQPAPAVAAAPEVAAEDAAVDEAMFIFGNILKISPTEVTIEEYDYEQDKPIEATYTLNDKTQFDNIKSVNDIVKGDEVGINYLEKDGKKVIESIYKYEDVPDEEVPAEEVVTEDVPAEQPAANPAK